MGNCAVSGRPGSGNVIYADLNFDRKVQDFFEKSPLRRLAERTQSFYKKRGRY